MIFLHSFLAKSDEQTQNFEFDGGHLVCPNPRRVNLADGSGVLEISLALACKTIQGAILEIW